MNRRRWRGLRTSVVAKTAIASVLAATAGSAVGVTPGFIDWNWSVIKSVDLTEASISVGDGLALHYTILLRPVAKDKNDAPDTDRCGTLSDALVGQTISDICYYETSELTQHFTYNYTALAPGDVLITNIATFTEGTTQALRTSTVTTLIHVAERTSVPEPATLALLGLGFAGIAAARRRKAA